MPGIMPGVWAPPVAAAPTRRLCSDCGVSRTTAPKRCAVACQFIRPDFAGLERRVHGRRRDPARGDERFFGPYQDMLRARLTPPRSDAQWTGITTRLGERLLEAGAVEAVLTVAPAADDRWRPVPILVADPAEMAQCRGMRMGYAPLLALVEPAIARGVRRLAVIALPCQVHALRTLEPTLGLERLIVIGTPCSDNTTTGNFHLFLSLLTDRPDSVTYLEFRADYHVELRFDDGRVREVPFLKLPISDLPDDFFPLTCRTCVDYTNSLADLTVGYMGGRGEQWLLVRTDRGAKALALLGSELVASAPTSAGNRRASVTGYLGNLERMAGGLPVRRMPAWVKPLVAWMMPRVGPRGIEFARARVEMKALETVVHLRRSAPRSIARLVPDHVWDLVAPYGVSPSPGERVGGGEDA